MLFFLLGSWGCWHSWGRSGNLSLIFCSATVAASVRIFDASSFTVSKFSVIPLPWPASIMIPLSMLPISPSSLSASGNTLVKPALTERRTPTAGPRVETTSPSSETVRNLNVICSSASLAFIINFDIFLTSASSFANTFARALSCFVYASTILAKIALSLWLNLSVAWSSFCTWSSMRLTAKSSRGFSGPGGFTASFMRF